jgi:hypothetical protein
LANLKIYIEMKLGYETEEHAGGYS